MSNKIKILKFQLSTAIFSLVILLLSGFFIFGPELTEMAKALSPNYNKIEGSSLGFSDWNNLAADFVARSGGATSAMQGNLDMGTHQIVNLAGPTADDQAVNRGTMNTAISTALSAATGSIEDTSGNPLRMVCGSTLPGAGWVTYPHPTADGVYIDIFNDSGFTSMPMYFAALYGTAGHWNTSGVTSIYFPVTLPVIDYRYFRIYIADFNVEDINSVQATTWGWYIRWCAIGQ